MKKYINYILLIVIFNSCASQHLQNNVENTFLKHLTIIEDFVKIKKNKVDGKNLQKSISFIENITGIKSDMYEGFETYPIPTKKNLRQWKKWFNKNKNRLYFDEKELKVKVKLLKTS